MNDGGWRVDVTLTDSGEARSATAKFVFIGAGGGALPLLQKSGIPEWRGYAGFPVSGIWLRCDNPSVTGKQHAKVYGKVAVGSPPMSVPHLDTRVIGGRRSLLFGPYAGFSSKFLKHGSLMDLFRSVTPAIIRPMLSVARDNVDLTEYLIEQLLQSESHRLATLDKYFRMPMRPTGPSRWPGSGSRSSSPTLDTAEFSSSEPGLFRRKIGRSSACWGPPPAPPRRLQFSVLQKCFPDELTPSAWLPKLKEIIPSYGISLIDDGDLLRRVCADTAPVLKLETA
jgi:malate dehydrogenase (quinone)